MQTLPQNEIIQKETYSNYCCGVQTAIKSALWQRNKIFIYQSFQQKQAA